MMMLVGKSKSVYTSLIMKRDITEIEKVQKDQLNL